MLIVFLRGLVIGFSIAAPVGPIGLLCIRRTLAHGRAAGLVLSGIASAFRGRLTPAAMRWVNRLSGTILAGFDLAALLAR